MDINTRLKLFAGACLLAPSFLFAQETRGTEDADASTVNYPAAYFEQYSPVSVNDMLNQIPGIDTILNVNIDRLGGGRDGGGRGLGATSPILIDGKRLAGKANEAGSQLDRIAASEVDYIEIVRGTSSELDVQNASQLINIVLKQAQSRSSFAYEGGVRVFDDGNVEPEATLSMTGQTGRVSYLISGSTQSGYRNNDTFELSIYPDERLNEIIELEQEFDQTNYRFNSNLTFDLTDNDRFALNALYVDNDPPNKLFRTITDFNGNEPITSFERELIPATANRWEIGGDYEHSFDNGNKYKFLFIVNERESEATRERFEFDTIGAPESKNLFLANEGRYQEKIIRTSYTFNLPPNQGLELGLEAAQTTQDSALRLGLPLPGETSPDFGGLRPVSVPNSVSTVEENRYEGFAIHNWRLNPRMSLESSLVAEFSEIEQTGDVNRKRDFDFLKPKLDFRFDINDSFQMRLSAEKTVSQLSFADFSASANNQDEDKDTLAGNPELVQEQWLQFEFNLDYRLPNNGGVLTSRLFYYDIQDVIGRIDISPSSTTLESTNGNVGDGRVSGLNLSASVRLGMFNLPQALVTAGLLVQDQSIEDPLIGGERQVVPFDRGSFRVGFRHDLPDLGLNYGFNYTDRFDGNRPIYDIDNVVFHGSHSNLSLFAEKSGFAGLTFRFEINNALDHENKRERRRYDGYLRDGVLSEIERFQTTNGPRYAFIVRGTF